MYYPQVADICVYASTLGEKTFLILDVQPLPEGSDYLAITNLLCLETGSYYENYSWPSHTWEKVA